MKKLLNIWIEKLRILLTGSPKGCWFFHTWDDKTGATRKCVKPGCGRVEVMSHL